MLFGNPNGNALSSSGVCTCQCLKDSSPPQTYVQYLDYSCAMGVGTGGGSDGKCYSLPQMKALGLASPTVISAANLPVGGTATYTLNVVWTGATQV